MYQQPRMGSAAEARQLQRGGCLSHGQDHGAQRHHDAMDDNQIGCSIPAAERLLLCKASEKDISIAEIYRVDGSGTVNSRHNSRFDQNKRSHGSSLPAGFVVLVLPRAKESEDHSTLHRARRREPATVRLRQLHVSRGQRFVNRVSA